MSLDLDSKVSPPRPGRPMAEVRRCPPRYPAYALPRPLLIVPERGEAAVAASILPAIERRLRRDRRYAARVLRRPGRVRALARAILRLDERARELFAEQNALVAFLRAVLARWHKAPAAAHLVRYRAP